MLLFQMPHSLLAWLHLLARSQRSQTNRDQDPRGALTWAPSAGWEAGQQGCRCGGGHGGGGGRKACVTQGTCSQGLAVGGERGRSPKLTFHDPGPWGVSEGCPQLSSHRRGCSPKLPPGAERGALR